MSDYHDWRDIKVEKDKIGNRCDQDSKRGNTCMEIQNEAVRGEF